MPNNRCGAPGCNLRDFHLGPCQSSKVAPERKRAPTKSFEPPDFETQHTTTTSSKSKVKEVLVKGCEYIVDRLLASKMSASGSRKFVVRWQNMGPAHDSWEPEKNIEDTLIRDFDQAPLKATWSSRKTPAQGDPCYLVDAILETRVHNAKPQSRLRWHGFPSSWEKAWIDDEKIIRGGPAPAAAAAATPAPPAAGGATLSNAKRPSSEIDAAVTDAASRKRPCASAAVSDAASAAAGGGHTTDPASGTCLGMEAVRAKLVAWRLEQYADVCEEMGFDDLLYLLELKQRDVAELRRVALEDLQMKPGHAEKFVTWMGER